MPYKIVKCGSGYKVENKRYSSKPLPLPASLPTDGLPTDGLRQGSRGTDASLEYC